MRLKQYILPLLLFTGIFLNQSIFSQPISPEQFFTQYNERISFETRFQTSPDEDSVISVLGRWAWGVCNFIDMEHTYAYIGQLSAFQILDVSDPLNPDLVGELLLNGIVQQIEVRDSVAVVAAGEHIYFLNISDVENISIISEITIPGLPIRIAVTEEFVYSATLSNKLWVVDITNLLNPFLRDNMSTVTQCWSLAATNRYIYFTNTLPGLYIINAGNPDSLTGVYFPIDWVTTLFIQDTLLFTGIYSNSSILEIYDISIFQSPELLGQVTISDSLYIDAITVSEDGQAAFILSLSKATNNLVYNKGIYSIDLINLNSPSISDTLIRFTQDWGGNIAVSEDIVAAAYGSGVYIADVSNPDSMLFKSFFPTAGNSCGAAIRDSILFLTTGLGGLWILDVFNPETPVRISNLQTGGFTNDVIVEDNIAYLINSNTYSPGDTLSGLWIIDISDLSNPKILNHYIGITAYLNIGVFCSIAKSENYIFITQVPGPGRDSIMEIIDVSDPLTPVRAGLFHSSFIPIQIAVKDNYGYLATSDGGLRIIDLTDIENPTDIGGFRNSIRGVYIDSIYAYTVTGDSLFILDISNPIMPEIKGNLEKPTGPFYSADFFVADDFLCWADYDLGVVDIQDKNNPVVLSTFFGLDWGMAVAVNGNTIYYADKYAGLWFLRNNELMGTGNPVQQSLSSELYQNYPNPFNSVTNIRYNVTNRDYITINLYNILGQKLETLFQGDCSPGSYNISFDGKEMSSGVYIYSMQSSHAKYNKKMIILK